jgi:predicted CoA-binding protein
VSCADLQIRATKSGQKYPINSKKSRLANFSPKTLFGNRQSAIQNLQSAMKKTLVLGATPNPARYAYLAVIRLKQHGHEIIPLGIRDGNVEGIEIQKGKPELEGVDTVTLYLNAERQREYYDYILSLNPKRIIFNPGTENPELMKMANGRGIETVEGCTLVMLSIGAY